MERAKTGVPFRAGLAQADVALNDPDDIGLLLYGLGEVGHEFSVEDKAVGYCAHLCKYGLISPRGTQRFIMEEKWRSRLKHVLLAVRNSS